MKKIVIKVGSSLGIIFSQADRSIYKIQEGSVLDLKDMIVETRVIKNKFKVKSVRERIKDEDEK